MSPLDDLVPRHEFLALARKHALVRICRCRECAFVCTHRIHRSRLGSLSDGLYAGEGATTELPDAAHRSLSRVGAIPLGFGGEFIARSLPRHGLRLEGFFERREDLPARPLPEPRGENLVCLAVPPPA